ncbi:RNA 3'-terminal phosphate cyclase-like protein [Harmonia axyridis]|uniref:RNA 3'-terminal phosphate cyclase-like protein n=1 Tax=Harmonia axyridis TaxID=115357 RepID=UPI001E27795F|nr:RNA 3'-terminal phosphate cyclase-like protein [Harmonia axyridis]
MGRKAGFNEGEKSKKGPGIAKKHKESLRPNGLKGKKNLPIVTPIKKGETLLFQGSTLFRQRLVLSVLSGKPVKIINIRKSHDKPGLHEYEVSLVRLLDKITNGTVVEIYEDGTSIFFQPGLLFGGTIEHDCSLERGIGYYLEALIMLSLFCKKPLHATLRGVTSNNIDPSVDTCKTSMIGAMKNFIYNDENLEITIKKRGLLPNGGGEIFFKCPSVYHLKPVQLEDFGLVKKVRGTAYALRVAPYRANKVVEKAKGVMLKYIPDVFITIDQRKGIQSGNSPGFGVHLTAETTKGVIYSAEKVSNPDEPTTEDIGLEVAQWLCYKIGQGGMVDPSSQAIALLFMALGPRDVSKIVLGELTEYAIEFLRNLKTFFKVEFMLDYYKPENSEEESETQRKVLASCMGIGYTNFNKRPV